MSISQKKTFWKSVEHIANHHDAQINKRECMLTTIVFNL